MKKFLILFIAVFALCSCSKDDDNFDSVIDEDSICAAECFFNLYYDDPIPSYKIQSLEIKDYKWPTHSESCGIVKVDASLITIDYCAEKDYELQRNVTKLCDDLKNIGSDDYVKCTFNGNPALQIVCIHQKTRGRYNKYIQ